MNQKKLWKYARHWKKIFEKIDAIFIKTPDENFYYFTNLDGIWENSFAIVYPDRIEVISPPLEEANVNFYRNKKELGKILKEMLAVDKIGFNGSKLSYKDFVYLKKITKAKLIDISDEIKKIRVIKNKEEINLIRKACKISHYIINNMELEGNEKQMAIKIECEIRRKGAEPAFPTIVAYGKNSSIPHHMPTNKKFSMPALIDFGARYKKYCSDLTRTFIAKRGKKVYEIVETALYMAIDEMTEGIKAKEVYEKIEKYFKKCGYKMRHALGHSIGLLVHDGFSLSKEESLILRENMVFAVEPAIYTKNYGIRIEEDVIIRKNKAEVIH